MRTRWAMVPELAAIGAIALAAQAMTGGGDRASVASVAEPPVQAAVGPVALGSWVAPGGDATRS